MVPFILHGDPSDPTHVWGEVTVGGKTSTWRITWPYGFSARYDPALEILDPSGAVVAREGQLISDAAGSGNGLDAVSICMIGGRQY